MSSARLAHVTLVVRDYEEAVAWFVGALGFRLVENTDLGAGKRWVRIAPPGGGADLLLAKAEGAMQEAAIGAAGGGRVAFFLHTDDFDASHAAMRRNGVEFVETPRDEPYGRVAVFIDLYGNRWDLVGLTVDQRHDS